VVEEGDPREVLTNPKHPATRALLARAATLPV
jgi:ABC-type dipeptide/oligopeptide/nickel transport system ATPase component